jgi:hypothetical protein
MQVQYYLALRKRQISVLLLLISHVAVFPVGKSSTGLLALRPEVETNS